MAKKRYSPQQITGMLRGEMDRGQRSRQPLNDVRPSQGPTVAEICRGLGVSEQSYYRWRREYGGMEVSQAQWLKALEQETEPLPRRCFKPN